MYNDLYCFTCERAARAANRSAVSVAVAGEVGSGAKRRIAPAACTESRRAVASLPEISLGRRPTQERV